MKNQEFFIEPPITNRGVVNTIGTKNRGKKISDQQYLLFDWIQATTLEDHITAYDIFNKVFKISTISVIESAGGLFGYDTTYSYRNIKVMTCSYRNDMGYHVYCTGSACRDIEDLQLDYHDLFKSMLDLGFKFTRIDVSVDDFSGSYSLFDIADSIHNGEIVSKFRSSTEFIKTKLDDNTNSGYTIWFGSRASDFQIVFYDKLKERETQGIIIVDSIDSWNRLECRFRNKRANEIIDAYVYQLNSFKSIYKGIIKNYINFVQYNAEDSNKSRWKTQEWWNSFLENVEKVQFQSINVESSITRSKNYLIESMGHTQLKVFLAELDLTIREGDIDFFLLMIKQGFKLLSDQDIQLINYHRLRLGLDPLDRKSIESLLRDIKEICIKK